LVSTETEVIEEIIFNENPAACIENYPGIYANFAAWIDEVSQSGWLFRAISFFAVAIFMLAYMYNPDIDQSKCLQHIQHTSIEHIVHR